MEFLRKAYNWVDQYTNAALVCFALAMGTLMLLATCTSDAATSPTFDGGLPKFDVVVDPSGPGVQFMAGPAPGTLVFCQGESGADGLHICQIWLMVSQDMGVPASGEAYCFVAGEEEVIHNGVPQTRTNWSCGLQRDELSEQRKARGPINLRERPKSSEVSI